jgi:hypothetical protein
MPDHAEDELRAQAALDVDLRAAARRQHGPQVPEHDQQDEGDDVVRDRVERHHDHAGHLQREVVAVVAGQAPSRLPSTQASTVATVSRPTVQGSAFQMRCDTGVGKADSDGPKSAVRMGALSSASAYIMTSI